MAHPYKILTALWLLASTLLLAGWSDQPVPAARKVECDCSNLPVDGRWFGTGLDTDQTGWKWTLTLKQQSCKLRGSFRWQSADGHSGTELVRGTLGCDRRLRLRGYQLKHVKGVLTTTRYRGTFSRDLRSVKGRWLDGIPGTFKGRKRK